MRARGLMDVLGAVYRLGLGEQEWLGGIAGACNKALGDRVGSIVVSTGRVVPGDYELTRRAWTEADPAVCEAIENLEDSAPPWTRALMHRHTGAMTLFEWVSALEAVELNRSLMRDTLYPHGIHDALIVLGTDVSGETMLLNGSLSEETELHPRMREVWNRVAVHFAAGLRLRRSIEHGEPMAVLDRAEAVFEPDGRVSHATGAAADVDLLEVLRDAVRRLDRARAAAVDPAEDALEVWLGLFRGRWSLLDAHDSDGRRYVVAVANDPVVAEDRMLTRRERQVVAMASLGQSDADISYALGLTSGTVRKHLQRGMTKMGITSRRVLMQVALLLIGGEHEDDAVAAAQPFLPKRQ